MGKRIVLGLASSLLVLLTAALAPAQAATVRYYVSDVLPPVDPATCVDPDVDCKDYYRLALDDAVPRPAGFAAVIPTHPTTGVPLFAWGIAYVRCGPDACAGVDADGRNFNLFQGAEGLAADLDGLLATLSETTWGNVTSAQKSAIRQKLKTELGLRFDYVAANALRVILQDVGRYLQPGFDESRLYVR